MSKKTNYNLHNKKDTELIVLNLLQQFIKQHKNYFASNDEKVGISNILKLDEAYMIGKDAFGISVTPMCVSIYVHGANRRLDNQYVVSLFDFDFCEDLGKMKIWSTVYNTEWRVTVARYLKEVNPNLDYTELLKTYIERVLASGESIEKKIFKSKTEKKSASSILGTIRERSFVKSEIKDFEKCYKEITHKDYKADIQTSYQQEKN